MQQLTSGKYESRQNGLNIRLICLSVCATSRVYCPRRKCDVAVEAESSSFASEIVSFGTAAPDACCGVAPRPPSTIVLRYASRFSRRISRQIRNFALREQQCHFPRASNWWRQFTPRALRRRTYPIDTRCGITATHTSRPLRGLRDITTSKPPAPAARTKVRITTTAQFLELVHHNYHLECRVLALAAAAVRA
jgi:hypothetical protein